MILLAVGVGLIILILIMPAAFQMYMRHRMTAELRRDWWPRFERDLREYMSHTWRSAREAERRI